MWGSNNGFEDDFGLDNHRDIQGAVNIASPYPETNNKLMYLLRKSLKVPFGIVKISIRGNLEL